MAAKTQIVKRAAPAAATDAPVFVPPNGVPPGTLTAFRGAALPGGRRAGPLGNVAFRLASGNKEVIRERRQAVINSREADRNSTVLRAGITKRAMDMVGKNLRLQSIPNHDMLGISADQAADIANQFEHHFSLWGDDPRKLNDATRHSSFGSQMYEVCRHTYGADGEAALIIRYNERRRRRYRGRYNTFVEVLDPDRISNPNGRPDRTDLCQGRVLDEWGAYEGLWVEKNHPSDAAGKREWEYVARETNRGRPIGVHWFPRHRAGAQRAMPAILSALRENRMYDTFDQKTLEAAIKDAFMSIVITTDATTAETLTKIQGTPTGGTQEDAYMAMMGAKFSLYEDFNAEGQAIPVMGIGDKISVESASHSANNTDSFRFAFDRKLAANLGMSYARYSGDYSKTSFSSIRAEFMDAWRSIFADRYEFCSSVPALPALALMEELVVTGQIDLGAGAPDFYDHMTEYAQCEFRGPAMGFVDPVKDLTASGLKIALGQSSPQQEAAAAGGDYFDNIDQTARAQAYAKRKLGHKVDYSDKGTAVVEQPEQLDPNADGGGGGGEPQTEDEQQQREEKDAQ